VVAITADAAEQLGLIVVISLFVLAALFARVLIGNLAKIAAAVILVAGAIFVWSQRSTLQQCVDRVRADAAFTDGPGTAPTCEVSGVTFSVDLPDPAASRR